MTSARIRAGDSDRQLSVDRLAQHFTAGRLDSTEYDDRVRRAYASVYLDELPSLFTDLPVAAPPVEADGAWRSWQHPDAVDKRGSRPVWRPRSSPVGLVCYAAVTLFLLMVVFESHLVLFPILLVWLMVSRGLRRGSRGRGSGSRR